MVLRQLFNKYIIMKYTRFIFELKDKKIIRCNELVNMNVKKQQYITDTFYKKYINMDPYRGPSKEYYYVNPLWICKNVFNNNCHVRWGCLECKGSGIKL